MAESSTQSTKRPPAVSARQRARQVMARKRAAEIEREKAIEETLATVLAAADAEQRAAQRRLDVIASADAAFDETMAEVKMCSGHALHRMKQLGESVAALAEMTGLPRARIAELVRLANGSAAAPEPERNARPRYAPVRQPAELAEEAGDALAAKAS